MKWHGILVIHQQNKSKLERERERVEDCLCGHGNVGISGYNHMACYIGSQSMWCTAVGAWLMLSVTDFNSQTLPWKFAQIWEVHIEVPFISIDIRYYQLIPLCVCILRITFFFSWMWWWWKWKGKKGFLFCPLCLSILHNRFLVGFLLPITTSLLWKHILFWDSTLSSTVL